MLDLRKLYQVVADEAAAKYYQLRVIDESGEDYLYPGEYFVPVRLHQAARPLRAETSLLRNNYVSIGRPGGVGPPGGNRVLY